MEFEAPQWSLPAPSAESAEIARARQARLTKPRGSLGRLEEVAVQMAAWQAEALPLSRPASLLIFAADHPVTQHGVSAYPQEVTAAMVRNFVHGGAASSVLARRLRVSMMVVDVGVAHPYEVEGPGRDPNVEWVREPLSDAWVGDLRVEDAMDESTLSEALAAGMRAVDCLEEPTRVLLLGEMGIGNTTPAAALHAALLGCSPERMVGYGTGISQEGWEQKCRVVRDALARLRSRDPWHLLMALGGREIAAMVGAAARALQRRMVILVDGFVVSSAMHLLLHLHPELRAGMIFAHRSQEPGHALVLEALKAEPLLDLQMRLGEGSGALSALPLLDLACEVHRSMATFAEAAVPEKSGTR